MKWIFEGRVYSSLEELSGKIMSEGNKPEPIFTQADVDKYAIYYYNNLYKKIILTPFDYFKNISQNSLKNYNNFYDYLEGEFGHLLNKVDVGEGAESESEL